MPRKEKDIFFFPNGHVSAYDENDEPIPDISSQGWLQLYFDYMESKGFDPTAVWMECVVNGEFKRVVPFKTEWGWNYRFEEAKKR